MDKLDIGETIPRVSLGMVRTDADGNYSLTLNSASVPETFIADSGQVDVDVTVADGMNEMNWSISIVAQTSNPENTLRTSATSGWAAASTHDETALVDARRTTDVNTSPTVVFDLSTGIVEDSSIDIANAVTPEGESASKSDRKLAMTTAVVAQTTKTTKELRARSSVADRSSGGVVAPMSCRDYTQSFTNNIREWYGHSQGVSGAPVTASQTASSNHSLGIAAKFGSSWSASGTRTITTGIGGSFPATASAYRVGNRVNYRNIANSCLASNPYRSQPNGFADVASDRLLVDRLNLSGYCMQRDAGATFTKDSGKNVTMSNALTVRGVSLTAQAGWGSSNKLHWKFTSSARLCGNLTTGLATSSRVVARPR
ncbi:hypothetical protein [Oerskovia flava]|uniref:hypothetical protein n=1 Tax=Oerskovia flava TaxID=2986422 RepID=UPI00223F797B|nr:hypothetical protein [Oerskovia sp. JB1-3-2]